MLRVCAGALFIFMNCLHGLLIGEHISWTRDVRATLVKYSEMHQSGEASFWVPAVEAR